MTAPSSSTTASSSGIAPGDPGLAARLKRHVEGEVLFEAFDRGRYSTDASIYQIEPIGVVIPKSIADVAVAVAIAGESGVSVLPRGGGTSQCGQTVGRSLVIDCSKHLDRVLALDVERRRAVVEPGLVLERLNRVLKPHKLFFPVDVSTSDRATIGGMTANNSCGSRSIRYGNMVHNVRGIDALLADGTRIELGEVPGNLASSGNGYAPRYLDLVQRMRAMHRREAAEIAMRFPKLLRRVGGYNIDMIDDAGHNMAKLLVGSEGTLAFFNSIELELQAVPPHRTLGVCHFPTFYQAMDATRHIVALGPSAVELVDRTMIDLSRDIAMYRPIVDRFVQGRPEALLLVEFSGTEADAQHAKLRELVELMGDLGFPDAVVEATDPGFQAAVWEVRKAGLNIMMSMKGDGKPISFIEDCAVALEDLAEYTDRLTQVFRKHGTYGTWYAHASVGCLHVRPVLNLKLDVDVKKMRAIAEEAFAMVREYKGSHSGEHGDGLVRSEFHEPMFGSRIVRAFEEVKDAFDPDGLFNPGKIVRPSRMDDRGLFRFKPGHAVEPLQTVFDWSEWGGLGGAVEMCNNNGQCRKSDPGVMCPSYRATAEEKHLTRGRANTLRLALSGQLGPGAFTSDALKDTLDLCVGCKGCKRECPTGVDMARMKLEFLHHYKERHGLSLRDRLIGYLPRYAAVASRLGPLLNLRDRIPGLAGLGEWLTGFSRQRPLPRWHAHPYRARDEPPGTGEAGAVVLFVDTFNRWFEPDNARAAERVLTRAGYRVHAAAAPGKAQPLCCGRSFLAAGMAEEAKRAQRRLLASLRPFVEQGVPIVGLEPSCLLTLRDELPGLLPGAEAKALASRAVLLEEFIAGEAAAGRWRLPMQSLGARQALVHGHCHQKAWGTVGALEATLRLVPGLTVKTFDATCCGMAGAFGYEAEHYALSLKIGELGVLPTMRAAAADTLLIAGGTSCRHQIRDGAGREALHPARILEMASAQP
ncbi:MAG: FAD-binding protein [Proteobacteria bacterium]|nr:FAD-binding protein [Pseudomonadota bacterium]MBI3497470.1 FAD-binding protein [Pseudomonadota bacterium]